MIYDFCFFDACCLSLFFYFLFFLITLLFFLYLSFFLSLLLPFYRSKPSFLSSVYTPMYLSIYHHSLCLCRPCSIFFFFFFFSCTYIYIYIHIYIQIHTIYIQQPFFVFYRTKNGKPPPHTYFIFLLYTFFLHPNSFPILFLFSIAFHWPICSPDWRGRKQKK